MTMLNGTVYTFFLKKSDLPYAIKKQYLVRHNIKKCGLITFISEHIRVCRRKTTTKKIYQHNFGLTLVGCLMKLSGQPVFSM